MKVQIEKPKREVRQTRSVRFYTHELKTIRKLAKLYANGDISLWIRHASITYRPSTSEVSKNEQ